VTQGIAQPLHNRDDDRPGTDPTHGAGLDGTRVIQAALTGRAAAALCRRNGAATTMKRPILAPWLAACAILLAPLGAATAAASPELTIVLIRHGEKPLGGLGQLDCQGLNRALALPAILARDFARPTAIYAPNPAMPKRDGLKSYDYIRPLATIEPTAIALGMPVDVSFGLDDTAALARHLLAPSQPPGVVLVAWEHEALVVLARAIAAASGGDAGAIPDWNRQDFDGIDVLHVPRGANHLGFRFEHRVQGLDHLPLACPGGNAP
jgi:hypothetical protein